MPSVRGERGPHGDHGQKGDQGDQGEKGRPGSRWINWIGYFILVIGMVVTVAFVVDHSKDQDRALCRGLREGSTRTENLLVSARDRILTTPVEARPTTWRENVEFLNREIEKLRFPLDCEKSLGLAE